MKKKRWRLVVLSLVLVVLIAAGIGAWIWFSQGSGGGFEPPAPDAHKALPWDPKAPARANGDRPPEDPSEDPAQDPSEDPAEDPSEVPAHKYELPVDVFIDDVPEVPEKIKGPSPPIAEDA